MREQSDIKITPHHPIISAARILSWAIKTCRTSFSHSFLSLFIGLNLCHKNVYRKTLGLAFYISTAIKKRRKMEKIVQQKIYKKRKKETTKRAMSQLLLLQWGCGKSIFLGTQFWPPPPARSSPLCPNEANKWIYITTTTTTTTTQNGAEGGGGTNSFFFFFCSSVLLLSKYLWDRRKKPIQLSFVCVLVILFIYFSILVDWLVGAQVRAPRVSGIPPVPPCLLLLFQGVALFFSHSLSSTSTCCKWKNRKKKKKNLLGLLEHGTRKKKKKCISHPPEIPPLF